MYHMLSHIWAHISNFWLYNFIVRLLATYMSGEYGLLSLNIITTKSHYAYWLTLNSYRIAFDILLHCTGPLKPDTKHGL